MPRVHFLNVKNGDCSIIQHGSGHVTVIDVCNAYIETVQQEASSRALRSLSEKGVLGNFNQKEYPDNPITYLRDRGIESVFRFIVTHPDMDHLDGVEAFFSVFSPFNLWDTDNNVEKESWNDLGCYAENDWEFYKKLRDSSPTNDPKRLTLYSGGTGQYWNRAEGGVQGGDGITILAPTPELVEAANENENCNDYSYVLLYRAENYKFLFAGDSHDSTWEHILANHGAIVENVDVLIAPHHGRDSGRSFTFLDVLKPRLTLFGNAPSGHLAYSQWSRRDLPIMTNNQAGSISFNIVPGALGLYVTHEPFAKKHNAQTAYSDEMQAYFVLNIIPQAS
jgi:competence protein ComEC